MLRITSKEAVKSSILITSDNFGVTFDTTELATNDNCRLVNNAVEFRRFGLYNTDLVIVLTNAGDNEANISVCPLLNGKEKENAFANFTIPAETTVTITLPWTVEVIEADSGIANISWKVLGGTDLAIVNAYAEIWKYC